MSQLPIEKRVRFIEMVLEEIEDITHLGAEGMTRLAHFLLKEQEIKHQIQAGTISFRGQSVTPHWWILAEDIIVDYRIRPIFGPKSPGGVFPLWRDPYLRYRGFTVHLTTDQQLYDILLNSKAQERAENRQTEVGAAIIPQSEENARDRQRTGFFAV